MRLTAAERLAVESWLASNSPTRAPKYVPPREAGGRFTFGASRARARCVLRGFGARTSYRADPPALGETLYSVGWPAELEVEVVHLGALLVGSVAALAAACRPEAAEAVLAATRLRDFTVTGSTEVVDGARAVSESRRIIAGSEVEALQKARDAGMKRPRVVAALKDTALTPSETN